MKFSLTALVIVAMAATSIALAAGGVAGTYTTIIKTPVQLKGKCS